MIGSNTWSSVITIKKEVSLTALENGGDKKSNEGKANTLIRAGEM